jgi:16S rRNA processing protein RimM
MTVDWDALITVGRIARPHGLRGHVVVSLETDFPEQRYRPGVELWVKRGQAPEPLRIAEARFQGGRPVIRFEGVGTIDDADALGRGDLRADVAALDPLPDGTFRHADLIGCRVVTSAGEVLGDVTKVEGQMTASCLVVRGQHREWMIPLAAGICIEIDPLARRIVVEPPEGLLDL